METLILNTVNTEFPTVRQRIRLMKRTQPVRCASTTYSNYYPYSDQSFNDVDAVLIKYFTFRSAQYTIAQVYETDLSPCKEEFNWLVGFTEENKAHTGDPYIEALYNSGRHDFANRIILNREGLMKQWLHEINVTGGLDLNVAMKKKNMELSRKQLNKSLKLTFEPEKSIDEV